MFFSFCHCTRGCFLQRQVLNQSRVNIQSRVKHLRHCCCWFRCCMLNEREEIQDGLLRKPTQASEQDMTDSPSWVTHHRHIHRYNWITTIQPNQESQQSLTNTVSTLHHSTAQHSTAHRRTLPNDFFNLCPITKGRHNPLQNVPHPTRSRRARKTTHRSLLSQNQILERYAVSDKRCF